jgi:hypothetical protein
MYRILSVMLLTAIFAGCMSDQSTAPTESALKTPDVATASSHDLPALPPPEDFVPEIDNPYLAFERGRIFTYEGETEDGFEQNVVEVTEENKTILGVATTVVHDQGFLDGELVEDTFDWFAQDSEGNVWYFGEKSYHIEGGEVVDSAGSWEAGVDGALPGIIMLAEPEVGVRYQQEFSEGIAEDMAKVVGLSETAEVPYGTFTDCLKTKEWTPLEPGAREFKFYALGTGLVLELQPRGQDERIELKSIQN